MLRRSWTGSTLRTSQPLTRMVPWLGSMRRVVIFRGVVLPLPEPPGRTSRQAPRTGRGTSGTPLRLAVVGFADPLQLDHRWSSFGTVPRSGYAANSWPASGKVSVERGYDARIGRSA